MTFDEVLDQVRELLQRRGRATYRSLKLRYQLDDELLAGVTDELIKAERVAADEDGNVLVWVGASPVSHSEFQIPRSSQPPASQTANAGLRTLDSQPQTLAARREAGERRQLTVMFCDLAGSTPLAEKLDPEDLREVVRAYQETCTGVIQRYEGHLAQHLGDGLLVYFGYPAAHEDDAQRAVRTGLGILAGLQSLNARLRPAIRARLSHPIQVRIGIHTGLVVIGEVGSSEKREILALGETPNIAARLQGLAEPDTVVISAATYRLVQGLFECQDRGPQELKGVSTLIPVYRVLRESEARSRFEVAFRSGLTPLIGREHEVELLQERWQRAQQSEGQVVLLSGEPGIGKSRLVQELKEQLAHEGVTHLEFHCSPYHQNSALYPIIDHLQRLLQFAREDSPAVKLEKLQHTLSHYRFPQADTVPLLAALLSLPHPEGYPPITVSPQKQKEKTHAALVAWLVEEAEQQPVYTTWEDVHWADPSTLEVLTLFLDQVPTTRLLAVLTFRPEFTPPWGNRSHLSQLTLSRLGRSQVEAMVERVTDGKALPPQVVEQIAAKTDGVPLFVEELTKTVMESIESIESIGSIGSQNRTSLPEFAIPATLHDSLMARLDRLGSAKEVAQLGATLGREFSYEVLQAVSPLDERTLQRGLKQLVEAELVYQRGLPPQAHYLFKHALIQDTAYQSLLKSTRQQYHRQIAQVLEEQFAEIKESQPELLAQHYTEAGRIAPAIRYWRRAGQRALDHSTHLEAIAHLTTGLELLKTLPETPERNQQELRLQITLGISLSAAKGGAAPEVGRAYARARELCRQLGETPQLFPTLGGLCAFYQERAELKTASELAEQMFSLAHRVQEPLLLLWAHVALGSVLYSLGELLSARTHLEQSLTFYDPQKHRSYGIVSDPRVICLSEVATLLWFLGYPDQALERSQEALALARELSHPFSLAKALGAVAGVHRLRRDEQAAYELEEARNALASEHEFSDLRTMGIFWRGWDLIGRGRTEEGIVQMQQGLTALQDSGEELVRPGWLVLLAEAYGKVGQIEAGLRVLAEGLAAVDKDGWRVFEAELYRLKGELTLQSQVQSRSSTIQEEAEEYFHRAIAIARRQSAKSLELRAVMSLSRLWQRQGKKDEAHRMLAEIYGWFSEGFDTKDLQEAKALLEELH